MLGDAFQRFPRQVQPVEIGVVAFQRGNDAQRLRVVIEAAVGLHQQLHRILAGMAKRGVAKVMGQRHRLCQIGVEVQNPRDGARDLRHLDRMGQAGAVIIALVFDKHLRLVFQTPKRRGMDDAIAVALKRRAEGGVVFRIKTTTALIWLACVGR
ncbi:hypothetical protein GALL_503940 [mine drainage metagenome]|uniref:Uncharacterized protein n=1 Tax=mine drainage metagenome TaxID=410659 RepID=A0A1J5P9Y6_9ZZZZ